MSNLVQSDGANSAKGRKSRRLAAILATDVVGYSRMMGTDEEATLALLNTCRASIDAIIEWHDGRIFHTAGDAVLAEFASPVEAVRCAVEFQAALEEIDADPQIGRMTFRVGINLGDVMVEGDQLFGDGVNIAARLEGIADPGGVCISGSVYAHIRNKLTVDFGAMGGQLLKNIAEPVEVYRLNLPGSGEVNSSGLVNPRATGQPANTDNTFLAQNAAIAVLPFEAFGGGAEAEAFADGLCEDLITVLASYRTFPVIARNSTFAFKGVSADVRTVAGNLGAAYVLEGSVRMAGARLRVSAQLIDAHDGHHAWASKFDRRIEDLFDVQEEIANSVAAIVQPELLKLSARQIGLARPESLDAWSWCQKGYRELDRYTREGTVEARRCFEEALSCDPDYVRAWVGVAYAHHRDIILEATDDPAATIRAESEAARQAVLLDDSDSMAHTALGGAFLWSRQFSQAIAEGERALDLNPSNVVAAAMLATALNYDGRPAESYGYFDRAIALNPQDPRNHIILVLRARAHLNDRDPASAVEWCREALRRRPDIPLAHLVLAAALGHAGDSNSGREALEQCHALDTAFARRWSASAMYRRPEDDDYFLQGLILAGFNPAP